MAQIRFRPRAIADLEDIGDYIATDNPAAASALIGRNRKALRPDTRSFPVGHYVLFYRPTSDGIEVIRVLHGARDVQSL